MMTDTTTARAAVPIALPFDDEGDAPVPFALTAAAHRAIDPGDVPALRVVPDRMEVAAVPTSRVAPDDLRPAQARALRRSGMRISTIAAAMGVDAALVTAWTADLAARPRRSRDTLPPRAPGTLGDGPGPVPAPGPAAGLAVALARVDADGTALTLADDRPDVLAAALDAIRTGVTVPSRAVRVAARIGSGCAADRLRSDLVRVLAVLDSQVVVGRWHEAADPEALDIRVRVAEPRAVRLVDSWARDVVGSEAMASIAVGVGG